MELHYEQMKAASSVTAAAVGFLTSTLAPQLILCKQVTIEVWEIRNKEQAMVTNTVRSMPIICCKILGAPESDAEFENFKYQQEHSTHQHHLKMLDLLLVVDIKGVITVLQWNANTDSLVKCSDPQIFKATCMDASAMINPTIISKPISLLADIQERGDPKKIRVCDKLGKSMVAICSFAEVIQVVSVLWTVVFDNESCCSSISSHVMRTHEHSRGSHDLQVHFLKMSTESGPFVNLFPSYKAPNILGLSFLGGDTSEDRITNLNPLDCKGRPLLAVLLAHQGLSQSMLSLECWAVDLINNQLTPGPWKISNLHPTTRLLLPWTYQADSEIDIGITQRKSGLVPKVGVLTISSANLTSVQANGEKSSLILSLKGIPTCYDICNNSTLIVQCITSEEASGYQRSTLFVNGEGGDAHVLELFHGKDSDFSSSGLCETTAYLQGEDIIMKEMLHGCSILSDSIAPVHDSMLICEDGCSSDHQLLLACGNAPNGTLRKMQVK